jgi:hypothetical protein
MVNKHINKNNGIVKDSFIWNKKQTKNKLYMYDVESQYGLILHISTRRKLEQCITEGN